MAIISRYLWGTDKLRCRLKTLLYWWLIFSSSETTLSKSALWKAGLRELFIAKTRRLWRFIFHHKIVFLPQISFFLHKKLCLYLKNSFSLPKKYFTYPKYLFPTPKYRFSHRKIVQSRLFEFKQWIQKIESHIFDLNKAGFFFPK
jgi:hypothetical protein